MQHIAKQEQGRASWSGPVTDRLPRERLRVASPPAMAPEGGGEHLLLDAVRRALRRPEGRMALVLHLSRLDPPAPRPHHQRIARAILQDTAQRHEGQVFALGNGDMVLLCHLAEKRAPAAPRPVGTIGLADPADLPATLGRLLRVDAPDPTRVISIWHLDGDTAGLQAYAAARAADAPARPPQEQAAGEPGQIAAVAAIAALVDDTAVGDLVHLQTGVLMTGPAGTDTAEGDGPSLRPIYRKVILATAALEARLAAEGQAGADPFLFRHLARRLDRRLLALLHQAAGQGAAGQGGPFAACVPAGGWVALHLELTLPLILSDAFAGYAASCRDAGIALGVEVSLLEACGDPVSFARARALLVEAGLRLILGEVSHLTLLIARPEALQPDLLKLEWSPRLRELPAQERQQLAATIERIGPDRILLHRADTETALCWGLSHDIRRFQGRHIDAMLAATRMVGCHDAAGCTLRECIERAAASGPAGRTGCRTPGLLAPSLPVPLPPVPAPLASAELVA
ncbi:hypothetical protein [Rhodovastum atsumiense]|uniref:EAL domain-containing protein n=1 Tax=Rhodovastum atsumiense TaxID=504468 RepID=A0A5M6ITH8_9PROT|nr:hypothetical protein [Rhodovastum atsumiense]KAA5611521.1 hypothetical protein F1189_14440 [Rhodovastum atsumiense]